MKNVLPSRGQKNKGQIKMMKSPLTKKKSTKKREAENLNILVAVVVVAFVLLLLPQASNLFQSAITGREGSCPNEPHSLDQPGVKLFFYQLDDLLQYSNGHINKLECISDTLCEHLDIEKAGCRRECSSNGCTDWVWACTFFPRTNGYYRATFAEMTCFDPKSNRKRCTPCTLKYKVQRIGHSKDSWLSFLRIFNLQWMLDILYQPEVYYTVGFLFFASVAFPALSTALSAVSSKNRKKKNKKSSTSSSNGFSLFNFLSMTPKKRKKTKKRRKKRRSSSSGESSSDLDTEEEVERFFEEMDSSSSSSDGE